MTTMFAQQLRKSLVMYSILSEMNITGAISLTEQETAKLLMMIRESYPNHFKGEFNPDSFKMQVRAWFAVFKDLHKDEVNAAFVYWLSTEKFPPSAADLNLIVRKNKSPESFVSPETAWEQVTVAVRRFGWPNMERARATLSEPIWRAIQNVGGWDKVCRTELGQPWDFLRKNFIQVFEDFGESQQSQALISSNVWERLQQMSGEKVKLNELPEMRQ